MKGKTILKVTGILMIIGGAISIIIGLVAIAGVGVLAATRETLGIDFNTGIYTFSAILVLVSAAMELTAGILGVKNCDKPDKATSCIVFGLIIIGLSLLGNILSVVSGGEFGVISFLISLVLPILFIIGAALNKQTNA